MNKKLATSVGAVAIVGAAIALTAGTYSYFHDEQTAGPQTVHAGTLKLAIGGSATSTHDYGNVAPGWSDPETITFQNTGSVNGTLTLTGTASGDSPLLSDIEVHVSDPAGVPGFNLASVNGLSDSFPLAAGQTLSVTYMLSIPADVENDIQGQNATFSLTGQLEQTH